MPQKLPFEDIPPPAGFSKKDVGIIASSFRPHNPMEEIFPDSVLLPSIDGKLAAIHNLKGTLRYVKLTLPLGMGLAISSARDLYDDSARAFFDEEIRIAALHFRLSPESDWDVWMSLAPIEIWSLRSGIRAATGNVVLGGLGMGYMLSQIAAKKSVKSITVVERDKALLDWYGYDLCKKYDKVVDVIQGDVFDAAYGFDFATTRFILDIWLAHRDASYDTRLRDLRGRGANAWAWGAPRARKN